MSGSSGMSPSDGSEKYFANVIFSLPVVLIGDAYSMSAPMHNGCHFHNGMPE